MKSKTSMPTIAATVIAQIQNGTSMRGFPPGCAGAYVSTRRSLPPTVDLVDRQRRRSADLVLTTMPRGDTPLHVEPGPDRRQGRRAGRFTMRNALAALRVPGSRRDRPTVCAEAGSSDGEPGLSAH